MKDQLHTIGHAPHDTAEYAEYISQSERLAAYASRRFDDEMNELETVTVSRPPDGFRMPSMVSVRSHDARINAGLVPAMSTHEDEQDEYQALKDIQEGGLTISRDEYATGCELELREFAYIKRSDGMREHSFRLPSQRSRRDVCESLRSMGCSFHD